MTTPTPYDTPGRGPWRRRGEVAPPRQAVRGVTTPVLVRPGLAHTASVGVPAAEVTSMVLPLEGAAGTKITIYNLDKGRADLTIDGESVKRENNGDFKIPMTRGGMEKLQVRAVVPGYPTIKFRGETLYKSPRPPIVYAIAYFASSLGLLVVVGVFVGIALTGALAMMLGYSAPALMVKAKGKGTVLLALIAVGLALITVGVAHVM